MLMIEDFATKQLTIVFIKFYVVCVCLFDVLMTSPETLAVYATFSAIFGRFNLIKRQ